jgi:hypothetical protein
MLIDLTELFTKLVFPYFSLIFIVSPLKLINLHLDYLTIIQWYLSDDLFIGKNINLDSRNCFNCFVSR